MLNTGEADRKNNSKLDLGTIKNGSAASDLRPEGPKKERWVDLCKISMIWWPSILLSPDAVVLNTGEADD